MISKRLKIIADFVDKEDIVLDVGCDHGYLDIYLKQNKICKEVYASDISSNALDVAKNNFKSKKLNIETFLSDGFKSIPVSFNTAIIAGMGTSTILKILSSDNNPSKLIISSHNELYKLRKNLNAIGYKIVEEKNVLENNHWYTIILCIKGMQRLNKYNLKFGISKNKDYYNYLYNSNVKLIKKVNLKKKMQLIIDNCILKIFY
jgi:tRNA (adenine22-N1)-methyltransferase